MAEVEKDVQQQEQQDTNTDTHQSEGNSGQQKDAGGSGSDDKPKGKVYTDEQLVAMATKEKQQGRRALAKELGVSESELKKIVAEHRANQPAEEQNAEILQRMADLEAQAARAQAESVALRMDAKSEYVDDVVDMVESRIMRGDSSDVKTLVAEIKLKHTHMFGKEQVADEDEKKTDKEKKDENKAKGQRGTGGNMSAKEDKGGDEEMSLGQRLAASRKKSQNTASKTYWGSGKTTSPK